MFADVEKAFDKVNHQILLSSVFFQKCCYLVGTYVSKTSYSVDSAVKKYFEYHKKSDILVNQSNSKI